MASPGGSAVEAGRGHAGRGLEIDIRDHGRSLYLSVHTEYFVVISGSRLAVAGMGTGMGSRWGRWGSEESDDQGDASVAQRQLQVALLLLAVTQVLRYLQYYLLP